MNKNTLQIDLKTNEDFLGYKYLIGSAIAFSLMSVCVKEIGGRLPIAELVFARALFSLIITRIMLYRLNINPWGFQKKLLLIRGFLGTGALFCIFKSLTILPIASATVIQYIYPTFAAISAYFILNEKINKNIIYSIIIGWFGIFLVVQPELITDERIPDLIISVIIAISGAFLTSLAYISIRKLSKDEHPLVIIHYFPLVSLPLTIPFLVGNFVIPQGNQWILLLGIGLFTQIGQIFITKGLRIIPVTKATCLNYSQVIFASIWGVLIFQESITISLYCGGLCVLISTIISMKAINKA